jgi:hypothetical protein
MAGYFKSILSLTPVFLFAVFFSCRPSGPHNKYREAKVRVSEKQLAQDKKLLKKGNKAYRKQMRSNRRHLFGRARAPKS